MSVTMIVCVAVLLLLAVAFPLLSRRLRSEDIVVGEGDCATCNGENTKCTQTCMMEAAVKEVEYYDDEELDAFAGRPSDAYTEDETAQFADVLYTMQQHEVEGWMTSLTLRGINLPDALKDEVIMMINETRS